MKTTVYRAEVCVEPLTQGQADEGESGVMISSRTFQTAAGAQRWAKKTLESLPFPQGAYVEEVFVGDKGETSYGQEIWNYGRPDRGEWHRTYDTAEKVETLRGKLCLEHGFGVP